MKKSHYAVIFTSIKNIEDRGYAKMAKTMETLASQQPGFLGLESAREIIGITVSYWESLDAIANWKRNTDHLVAQTIGKEKWYKTYSVRICKVEREYHFSQE